MKIVSTLALLCFAVGVIKAANLHHNNIKHPISADAGVLKSFSLRDTISGTFYIHQGLSASWLGEDLYYTHMGTYVKYNVETREETLIFDIDLADGTPVNSATLSPDLKYVLFGYDRYGDTKNSYNFFIVNIETKDRQDISQSDYLVTCQWVDNATEPQLIYVKENDVYFWKNNSDIRVTDSGVTGVILNGFDDTFADMETSGFIGSIWISPHGKQVAFATYNYENVKEFQYDVYGKPGDIINQYPERINTRYQKPGTPHPTVALTVVDFDMNKLNVPAPVNKVSEDHYLEAVAWLSDDILVVSWMNRRQQIASIQRCKISLLSCDCEEVVSFSILNGWIENIELFCPTGTGKCFYMDNFENWRQIFSFGLHGKAQMETTGDHIAKYIGYDAATSEVYYTVVADNNPQGQHVYRGSKCLSCDVITPENNKCNFASGTLSQAYSYYSLTCDGPDPSFTRLYRSDTDQELYTWKNNDAVRTKLKKYQTITTVYSRVPVEGGFSAAVKLQFPSEIDLANPNPDVTYPMIVHVYTGPNSALVQDSFNVDFSNYLITDRKIIYAEIDGRGTGNKGLDMLYAVNDKLGTVEVEDQITVTKYILEKYSFIDPATVGIWGVSYGGYATAMTLARDSDLVFKCGIAVAPVTNWIYYNAHYTESYMGTPQTNAAGYFESDITHRAKNFIGHKFLLVHGTADSNVHYQHAMALSRALQLAKVPFEQMNYSDEDHDLSGVNSHYHNMMSDFWDKCFE